MNVLDLLNHNAYRKPGENVRDKYVWLDATKDIAAGVLDMYYFVDNLSNPLTSNKKFPISSSEIFFVDVLNFRWQGSDQLTGDDYKGLMKSFLEISVNERTIYKTSLCNILNFGFSNFNATDFFNSSYAKNEKEFINSIIINSTANVKFRVHLDSTLATAYDGVGLQLNLGGLQYDKLEPFMYNELKNNMFQRIDFDFYDIQSIVSGSHTYSFFVDANRDENLFSKVLPLSNTEIAHIQSLQVLMSDQDAGNDADFNLWFPRMKNRLTININDVAYYDGMIQNALSFFGNYTQTSNNRLYLKQKDVIKEPLTIPSNSKNSIQLVQGAETTPQTDELVMLRMQGELIRTVQ